MESAQQSEGPEGRAQLVRFEEEQEGSMPGQG
jgi:hypothetical protein